MRRLAHISDIHFGREDSLLVTRLIDAITAAAPDVIALSGDLTQRARVSQFKQARAFLDALPDVPLVVVPGNHDISATNPFERLIRPLARYTRHITSDLTPFFSDEQIAIAGLNSVRVLSSKDGRINHRQIAESCSRFHLLAPHIVRIVMTHHPIDLPAADTSNALIGRAATALPAFADCNVDLFLSGHLHTGQTLSTAARYGIDGYCAIVAHAGTAVSTRTRGEPNSWNLIHIDRPLISIEQQAWNPEAAAFQTSTTERYQKLDSGWARRVA